MTRRQHHLLNPCLEVCRHENPLDVNVMPMANLAILITFLHPNLRLLILHDRPGTIAVYEANFEHHLGHSTPFLAVVHPANDSPQSR